MRTAALAALSLLAACKADEALLQSGSYTLVHADLGTGEELTVSGSLALDVDAMSVTITDAAGAEVSAGLGPVDEELWPIGCPTNISSTLMEVVALDLAEVELDLDGSTSAVISGPVLVAGCPDGQDVLLRDALDTDGAVGGSYGCEGAESCLDYALD